METFCSLFAFTRISPGFARNCQICGSVPDGEETLRASSLHAAEMLPLHPQECSRCTRRAAAGLQRLVLARLWQKECAEAPREPRLAQQVGAGAGEAAPWLANTSRRNTSQIPPAPTFYFCVF